MVCSFEFQKGKNIKMILMLKEPIFPPPSSNQDAETSTNEITRWATPDVEKYTISSSMRLNHFYLKACKRREKEHDKFRGMDFPYSELPICIEDIPQGVLSKISPLFELTDLVIHFRSRRQSVFGRTDLGRKGIDTFFSTHRCSSLCSMLNKRWFGKSAMRNVLLILMAWRRLYQI
eukprot:scaffold787_cov285-Chaetoceros_neogracile.AAC.5